MRSFSSFSTTTSLDRTWWLISFFVISAHIALIALTEIYAAPPIEKVPKKQALIVQTVSLNPTKPTKSQPAVKSSKVVAVADPVSPSPQVEAASPPSSPASPEVKDVEPAKVESPKKEIPKQPEKKTTPPKAPAKTTSATPKKTVKEAPKKAETKPKAKVTPKKEVVKPKTKPAEVSKPNAKSTPKAKPVVKKEVEIKPKTSSKESSEADKQAAEIKALQAASNKAKEEIARAQEKAAKAKRLDLIANAQNSIAKMNQSNGTMNSASSSTSSSGSASVAVPGKIENLAVETFPEASGSSLSEREITYYDELASRLKLLLRLPDYGEVKIKLTLERAGKFVKVSIVHAESSANKKYIEKTLPTLKYPSFGNNFTGMAEYTFVISLSNDL